MTDLGAIDLLMSSDDVSRMRSIAMFPQIGTGTAELTDTGETAIAIVTEIAMTGARGDVVALQGAEVVPGIERGQEIEIGTVIVVVIEIVIEIATGIETEAADSLEGTGVCLLDGTVETGAVAVDETRI